MTVETLGRAYSEIGHFWSSTCACFIYTIDCLCFKAFVPFKSIQLENIYGPCLLIVYRFAKIGSGQSHHSLCYGGTLGNEYMRTSQTRRDKRCGRLRFGEIKETCKVTNGNGSVLSGILAEAFARVPTNACDFE
uniref:Uncharacterized protein n=1 Tax=Glossina palpalis gambiensis TaxID=67801 RepID=A0A1B0AVR7_9MUSC